MRGQPDVESSNLCTPVCILVLDDVARNRTDAALPRSRIEPTRTSPSWRKFIVDANDLLTHRGDAVVHQRSVLRDFVSWPRHAGPKRLANRIIRTGASVSTRLQHGGAHRLC